MARLVAIVALLGSTMSASWAADWQGHWKVISTGGIPYYITLSANGRADSTLERGFAGSWEEKDGRAYITFASGWKAILFEDHGVIMKSAFKPGRSFLDKPNSVTPAGRIEAIPQQ